MANPADAVAIGLVSAETAAVIQTGAFSPVSIGAAIPAQMASAGFKVGISAEEIAAINFRFGGAIAFRDTSVIMANASRYDGFYNKILSIIKDIAGTHVFDNGNKRTAVEVAERLIARNGVDGPPKEIIWSVVERTATGKLTDVNDIAKALKGLK